MMDVHPHPTIRVAVVGVGNVGTTFAYTQLDLEGT